MVPFALPERYPKTVSAASSRVRVEAADVVSETVLRRPDPCLEGIVSGEYQGWKESSKRVVRRREVPICEIPWIINFGAPFGFIDPFRPELPPRRLNTFVAGVYDSFVIIESRGDSCCIQVNFTLLGARRVFQLPLGELANRTLGLDDLYGDRAARVIEALAHAADWDRRFELLDSLIVSRIAAAQTPRSEIRWAWRLMQEANGSSEIGSLARELGWSHKHMIATFRDQLGAPPKQLARSLRFKRALQLIDGGDRRGWAALALASGYFDQSHMIREFRALAGCTPKQYLSLRLPDGGISAEAAADCGNS
jgi:AraC-like DNA-binding protein